MTEDGRQRTEKALHAPRLAVRLQFADFILAIEKTSFASNASGGLSGQAPDPRLVAYRTTENGRQRTDKIRRPLSYLPPSANRMRFLFTMSEIRRPAVRRPRIESWPNSRSPPTSSARALDETDKNCIGRHAGNRRRTTPAAHGGARRDRTDDLMLAKHALSQLSYSPAGLSVVRSLSSVV
jgi:hypothetical protein